MTEVCASRSSYHPQIVWVAHLGKVAEPLGYIDQPYNSLGFTPSLFDRKVICLYANKVENSHKMQEKISRSLHFQLLELRLLIGWEIVAGISVDLHGAIKQQICINYIHQVHYLLQIEDSFNTLHALVLPLTSKIVWPTELIN